MNARLAIRSALFVPALCTSVLLAAAATAEADGKGVYAKSCAVCHGAEGHGDTPTGKALKTMDLGTKRWASLEAVPEIAKAVREGVPRMPAMASKLAPEEIESVARYTQQMAAARNPQQ